jgi:hypothetical protein
LAATTLIAASSVTTGRRLDMSKNKRQGNSEAKKNKKEEEAAAPVILSGTARLTVEKLEARGTYRPVRVAVAPTHRFNVGVHVAYRDGPGSGLYRVTRHLPDEGRGLQYRIRSDRDGQERVVLESALQHAT